MCIRDRSDLDLILVCDADDFAQTSGGGKPLPADVWFGRAARRFIGGLTAATAEGVLYDVDTRLRPSGGAGPLVTKLSGFESYQRETAWTWEHMALTQSHVLCGSEDLRARIEAIIAEALARPRDMKELSADVAAMRERMHAHRPTRHPWDVKNGIGGLRDIEFLAQTLQLAHGGATPEILHPRGLRETLAALHEAAFLKTDTFDTLDAAARDFAALRQITGLCVAPDAADVADATLRVMLEALGLPDRARLDRHLHDLRAGVAERFAQVAAGIDGG